MVTAFGSHQCGLGSHESPQKSYMWVEFVVAFVHCTETFFRVFKHLQIINSNFSLKVELECTDSF